MRFLIIKTSALGDILHAFPLVDYLREKFPQAKLDWLVEEAGKELLLAHPSLNKVFSLKFKQLKKNLFSLSAWKDVLRVFKSLRKEQYDLVIDLQGNTKSAFFAAFARTKSRLGFARPYLPEWPNILLKAKRFSPPKGLDIYHDLLFLLQQYFKDQKTFRFKRTLLKLSEADQQILESIDRSKDLKILIAPFSHWDNKQMDMAKLQEFLGKILEKYPAFFYIIWGTNKEHLAAKQLQSVFSTQSLLLPKLSFPLLQHLMKELDCVLSMDSLPLHLAASANCPSFAIFGPSSMQKYHRKDSFGFQGHCPFSQTFEKRCKFLRTCSKAPCMKEIDTEALFNAFSSFLTQEALA